MELAEQADAAGVAALFAEDGAVYWEERQAARGTAQIQAFMERTFDLAGEDGGSFAPDRVDVAASGDLAVEQGSWQDSTDSGRYMTLHQKVDGEWKILTDMSVSQAPNGGAPGWAQALLSGWYDAFNARDAAGLADRYYTPDASVGTARGREAIIASFEEDWDGSDESCSGSFSDFQVVGTVAVGWGVDRCVTTSEDGTETTEFSRWIGVYERQQDGSWLSTRDIGEPIG
jgi:ketosteroid isomerase-like protein